MSFMLLVLKVKQLRFMANLTPVVSLIQLLGAMVSKTLTVTNPSLQPTLVGVSH